MVSSRIAARLVHTNQGHLITPDDKFILMLLKLFQSSAVNPALQCLLRTRIL